MASEQNTRLGVRTLFLGADPIPLRRRVKVDSVQPHPPSCKVVSSEAICYRNGIREDCLYGYDLWLTPGWFLEFTTVILLLTSNVRDRGSRGLTSHFSPIPHPRAISLVLITNTYMYVHVSNSLGELPCCYSSPPTITLSCQRAHFTSLFFVRPNSSSAVIPRKMA